MKRIEARNEETLAPRAPAQDAGREARLQVLEAHLSASRRARLEAALQSRVDGVAMVVDGVHDLGNASAIMRTCEGLGVQNVYLIELVARYRVAGRTSQGSHKWLDIHHYSEVAPCVQALRQRGYRLLGAALETETTLASLDVTGPVAVVLGNEHSGLSPEMLAACDGLFRIEMHGLSQSFNVSVAAAITLHDILRRKRAAQARPGDLDAEALDRLRERFYRKAIKQADAILTRALGEAPPPMPEAETSEIVSRLRAQEAAEGGDAA